MLDFGYLFYKIYARVWSMFAMYVWWSDYGWM